MTAKSLHDPPPRHLALESRSLGPEQWRDLLQAFLVGRLNDILFTERFLEAFQAQQGAPAPSAIQELRPTVEAYDPFAPPTGSDGPLDEPLRRGAARAARELEAADPALTADARRGAAPKLEYVLPILKAFRASARASGIEIVGVVGSVARGDAWPDSDVDVVYDVVGRPSLFDIAGLAQDLADRLGREVDLVDRQAMAPERWRFMSRDLVSA